ncbi:MAG: hypothetical protein AABX72_01560 [Nanoarchaeota archaeon]
MKDQMQFYYDKEGDFLEITSGSIANCYFDNQGDGIFEIIDKETKEIKGIAIHDFRIRSKDNKEIKFSLHLRMKISSS